MVTLAPGFGVQVGGVLHLDTGAVSYPPPPSAARGEAAARAAEPAATASQSPRILPFDDLPVALQDRLVAAGDHTARFDTDELMQWVVFATATALTANDGNALEDVYLYDLAGETLMPISLGHEGATANGPSSQPAIDGVGERIVYSSGASDLVADDTNEQADIFLYDIARGATERVSHDEQGGQASLPARNPAPGGWADEILFDRPDPWCYRQI